MIPSTHIQAIFFDLDGTLRHSVPSAADVFTNYVITLGLPVDEEARLRAMRWEHLYWASSMDLRDDLLAHSGETENFWIEYSRRRLVSLGAAPEWAAEFASKVSKHMGEFYRPESIVPEDVRRTLSQLKQAGYFLGVISNRDFPFVELLQQLGIGEFFEYCLAAGEVNIFKPEPGVFEHALRQTNFLAQNVAYVGDNYYADVVGARRAGLQPILYDPRGVFPDSDCATIQSFDELKSVIKVVE